MSPERRVIVYGGSGYTGKIIAESLAQRRIPFYFAGRNREKLEAALAVVRDRLGAAAWQLDAEVVAADATTEALLPWFQRCSVVVNVAGPFMQVAWPVLEAAWQAGCHYLDTTGEQDWVREIAAQYGPRYAGRGLLLAPATAFMWSAGALAAEVVLEDPEIDSLDILYQIDNGLPSEASTKSFLRMVCNPDSQYYLEQGSYHAWPNDVAHEVFVPYRHVRMRAHPWGGGCEPVWLKDRVRNCRVLTVVGEHMIGSILQAIQAFNAQCGSLDAAGREALTNAIGDRINTGEPPKDDLDVQRGVIVVYGQGRTRTSRYVMNLSAAYSWTGEVTAEATRLLYDGKLLRPGFQSVARAFDHRQLVRTFNQLGYCSALPG